MRDIVLIIFVCFSFFPLLSRLIEKMSRLSDAPDHPTIHTAFDQAEVDGALRTFFASQVIRFPLSCITFSHEFAEDQHRLTRLRATVQETTRRKASHTDTSHVKKDLLLSLFSSFNGSSLRGKKFNLHVE